MVYSDATVTNSKNPDLTQETILDEVTEIVVGVRNAEAMLESLTNVKPSVWWLQVYTGY